MKNRTRTTREPQYQRLLELKRRGITRLGLMTNQAWHDDPKHVLFTLSRYKFVAKMLSGSRHVLEVGCADAFGTRLVLPEVGRLTAVDFDPLFIADARERMEAGWRFACRVHNVLRRPVPGAFDGAYALDVIEHIRPEDEDRFLGNIVRSLTPTGVLILGTPSVQSQAYASEPSRAGHVNCKDAAGLKELLERFFHRAFVFSMNDEVIHTGYYPMAHYLMALACHRRNAPGARSRARRHA